MTDTQASAIIVGGGPAGLMAAELLADAGLAVTVFDQRRSLGRKFLLAGRGGLNITHAEDIDQFVSRYGGPDAPERMAQAVAAFSPSDLSAWCAGLGQPTFAGSSGRVFPEAFRATPLLRAWLGRLSESGVQFRPQHRWLGPLAEDHLVQRFEDDAGQVVQQRADVVILAMGGASWPRVGGDGGWVAPLEAAGVAVAPLESANCGVQVQWTPTYLERFEGQPLKNVALTVGAHTVRGDCVVTRLGLEGGPVYAHSAALRQNLNENATLGIDLLPDLDDDQLLARLNKRRPKDTVSSWLRKAGLPPISVGLLREVTSNTLPERITRLAALIKAVPLRIDDLMPLERAISSSGGVRFDGLDDHLMVAALPGLFVAGEMLDWEAPTGGYLLQGCFSTGVMAARGALAHLNG